MHTQKTSIEPDINPWTFTLQFMRQRKNERRADAIALLCTTGLILFCSDYVAAYTAIQFRRVARNAMLTNWYRKNNTKNAFWGSEYAHENWLVGNNWIDVGIIICIYWQWPFRGIWEWWIFIWTGSLSLFVAFCSMLSRRIIVTYALARDTDTDTWCDHRIQFDQYDYYQPIGPIIWLSLNWRRHGRIHRN